LSQATLNTYLDYAYDNPNASNTPTRYLRKSELAYISESAGAPLSGSTAVMPGTPGTGCALFFQAPADYTLDTTDYGGLDSVLNTCGYFISFAQDTSIPPYIASSPTVAKPYRYRLMQLVVPTESNTIYASVVPPPPAVAIQPPWAWFTNYSTQANPIADNIIVLVVRPLDPSAVAPASSDISSPSYSYDSTANALTTIPQPATANQLPPVIQITMVAIDETSAKHIDNGSTQPSAIKTALAASPFTDTTKYQTDLTNLQNALTAAHIQYNTFISSVPIRESKWTK
jgi:uncharacterized protein (TIGR02599 family)